MRPIPLRTDFTSHNGGRRVLHQIHALPRSRLQLEAWDFRAHKFVITLHVGEDENPFVRLPNEMTMTGRIKIGADTIALGLTQDTSVVLLNKTVPRDEIATLSDLGLWAQDVMCSTEFQEHLRRYLHRWELLGKTQQTLSQSVEALATVFDDRPPSLPSDRPWASWIGWLGSREGALPAAVRAISADGVTDSAVEALDLVASDAPTHFRLVIESSLLFNVREGTDSRGYRETLADPKTVSLLQEFAAPGETLPTPLHRKIDSLLTRFSQLPLPHGHPPRPRAQADDEAVSTAFDQVPPLPHGHPPRPRAQVDDEAVSTAFDQVPPLPHGHPPRPRAQVDDEAVSIPLFERLANMQLRYGWSASDRQRLQDMYEDTPAEFWNPSLKALEDLVEERDAEANHLILTFIVRREALCARPRSQALARIWQERRDSVPPADLRSGVRLAKRAWLSGRGRGR